MQINQLQPKQQGIVYFDSSPHNAKIYVDGQLLVDPDTEEPLRTPARALLYEGRRNFTYVLEGHEDVSGYVDIYPGATVNIFRNMKPGVSEEGWGEPEPQIWLSHNQQTGTLKVYSYPDGADVYIDGKLAGIAPTTISNVPEGAHRVTFKMPGMMIEEKIVDIHPGAWSEIDAIMRPVLPGLQNLHSLSNIDPININPIYINSKYEAKTMQTGCVTVTSNPSGAKIYVDGVLMKERTPAKLILDPGQHYITTEMDGYFRDYSYVYIYPGSDTAMQGTLTKIPYSASSSPESELSMRRYIRTYFMSEQIKPDIIPMQGPTTGWLVITTYPAGATIELDGRTIIDTETKEILRTPVQLEVGMGMHNLVYKLPGYCPEFDAQYITPGSTVYTHKNFSTC